MLRVAGRRTPRLGFPCGSIGTIKLYARIASKLAPTDPALAHVGASLLAINPHAEPPVDRAHAPAWTRSLRCSASLGAERCGWGSHAGAWEPSNFASKLAPTDPALAHVGASLLAINPHAEPPVDRAHAPAWARSLQCFASLGAERRGWGSHAEAWEPSKKRSFLRSRAGTPVSRPRRSQLVGDQSTGSE